MRSSSGSDRACIAIARIPTPPVTPAQTGRGDQSETASPPASKANAITAALVNHCGPGPAAAEPCNWWAEATPAPAHHAARATAPAAESCGRHPRQMLIGSPQARVRHDEQLGVRLRNSVLAVGPVGAVEVHARRAFVLVEERPVEAELTGRREVQHADLVV